MRRKKSDIEVIMSERPEPSEAFIRLFDWLLSENEDDPDGCDRGRQKSREGISRDVTRT